MKIIDDHQLAAVLDQHIGDDGRAYDEMIRTGKVSGSEMVLDLYVEAMEDRKPETVVITRDGRRVRRLRGHWVADSPASTKPVSSLSQPRRRSCQGF